MINYQRLTAEINLDAVKYNLKNIRRKIGDGIKMICVIKADAYGHGAADMAETMVESGADMFAVAFIDEAIALRKSGVDVPILILGFTPENRVKDVIKYDITQTVFTRELAECLDREAETFGKKVNVHIKIDTGMGRIGFRGNEKDIKDIKFIAGLKNINTEGVFTHFSTADESDKEFTSVQAERFRTVIERLKNEGIEFSIIHCANSAGIMDFDDLTFNAVRPGIIQYGLYPSDDVKKDSLDLMPVMALKSHISFIKEVDKGTPIGYGRTYVAPERRVIATIPVGYADGYLRAMKNGGRVIINGKYAPITGRICMDQFMVDITEIDNTKIGDEVIIMGKKDGLEITADEIASIMGTINYEVVCLVSRRVPRVYMENGSVVKEVSYLD